MCREIQYLGGTPGHVPGMVHRPCPALPPRCMSRTAASLHVSSHCRLVACLHCSMCLGHVLPHVSRARTAACRMGPVLPHVGWVPHCRMSDGFRTAACVWSRTAVRGVVTAIWVSLLLSWVSLFPPGEGPLLLLGEGPLLPPEKKREQCAEECPRAGLMGGCPLVIRSFGLPHVRTGATLSESTDQTSHYSQKVD